MDQNTPKIVRAGELVPTPEMEALIAEVERSKHAMELANAAPSIEVNVGGKVVKHLNVRLSTRETQRVMSLPDDLRAKMATQILLERQLASQLRRADDKEKAIVRRETKRKRKAQANARRRNR